MHEFIITALSVHMPPVLRWAGAIARRLRGFNIGLAGKSSGSAATDALTLADLSLQELIVSALRDCDPIFRHCRIDAEESTGDLGKFPSEADLTIGIDPIDGTKKYRDGQGPYCGALIQSPNVYDFPVSLHLCRILGGDAVWVHNNESVHFQETWLDSKSDMRRLPGIVACSSDPVILQKLVTLSKDWNPDRYRLGNDL